MVRRLIVPLVALCLLIGAPALAATSAKPPKPDEDYYELYKVLVDTMYHVEKSYVKEVDRRELVEAAIQGVLSKLDPYSTYIGPKQLSRFRTTVESEFGGIGIQITVDAGQLKVISPLVGTPAYRAGLVAGDRIIEIDGKSTDGLSIDEAIRQLKGKEGSAVKLTVVHPGTTKKLTIPVTRERIHVETVLGDRRKDDDSWDFMYNEDQGIGYIRITAFSRDTTDELQDALEELTDQGLKGLVLDLRFNPGGLLSSAIAVSDLFVADGRIVSTKGRNTPERTWDARKKGTFEGFPMAVLVNRYSASASEIVSACLQDHKRAIIVGERTWGKGSVQNVIDLEDGASALKLTTASYRRPSGKNIHRFHDAKDEDEWGVMPDDDYVVELGDGELLGLIADRRERDIVRPKPSKSEAAANAEHTPEQADSAEAESEDSDVKDPQSQGNPENGSDAGESEEPPAEEEPSETETPPFVDRQLNKALEYLTTELARAD